MSDHTEQAGLPVIAIGASAGGLDASREFLKALQPDMQAAFILILHLDPSHDSMMVDLLADHTKLKVVQAADGLALAPGCLYVIPPGVFLTISQQVMRLSAPDTGKSVRLPFDVLLRSLAKDAGERSGCVVLSGTGADGSAGLADIHAAGGLVIAQDPEDAAYPGMPQNAIKTGLVSHALPVSQMRTVLEKFIGLSARVSGLPRHLALQDCDAADPATIVSGHDYDRILSFLGDHAVQDISLYKRGTLERRVSRRIAMLGLGVGELARYLEILKADPEERRQLSSDLLIHVTSFFRDPEVFAHLSSSAAPDLVAAAAATDKPIRIWVAGCSTGEEAYSLAMIFLEVAEKAGGKVRLQVLASDIDPDAIATARAGFFSKDIEADVSPQRLARFFVPENGGWRVVSALRDLIVFTVADLLSDPPFSKIDLVSCRNVLIYLGPDAQKRVIARCCFALRQDGLLLLGAAEMPGQGDTCFATADKEARLWRRVGKSHTSDMHFAIKKREEAGLPLDQRPRRSGSLADLCRKLVLENYAPAAVLLNAQLDCVYLLGPTEKYLKVSQGHLDPGILGMLPKSLRARFRAAVASCNPENPVVKVSGDRLFQVASFDIALHSVTDGPEPLLLACFLDVAPSSVAMSRSNTVPTEDKQKSDLEADLQATRRDLSDALRDLEEEVEAHGAERAEALSVNEEFQSTNEELLASKEELQSLNEELTALNGQLQETLERHRTTANDLQNVLFSTDVATLFLDRDLNIRFFTPATRAIFRLIASDIGRPLADLASVTRDDDPTDDARAVLVTSGPIEREIAGAGTQWFLRRVQPYRTEGGHFEGVVITYVDITERKRINAALEAATQDADRATRAKSRFLASASHDLRQPMQAMALLNSLIARHKRSGEGARLTALLDQTLTSMTAMLDSMLDVNRIESGVVRPVMRPVAILPLMQRLVDEFAPQCELKHLKLRFVPCNAWVNTDPQLLEQMLRNLLSNALKYTQDGGILLGCRRRDAALTIQVYDTGIGVSKSETSTIFDAYHQGAEVQALAGQGLGLGLSIVQRLATLMDHPVALRSKPGKGSAFMITVPMVDPATEEPRTKPVQIEHVPISRHGTILMVEDEGPLRELLEEFLVKDGHTVIAHSNAKDALSWVSGDVDPPDLLLTDFDLRGGINGLRLAQDIPDVLGNPVPTIVLTGDITVQTLQAIGATEFKQVTKPVMPQVLLALISDMLQDTHKARSRTALRKEAAASTVHVIDDDPMIRETMRRLFEAENWNVICYASAEDFLALPRPDTEACLLVDALLPGMSGVELLTRLQAENSQMPAVVLTGYGDAAMAVAVMKAGASDLIEKPASAAELISSVRYAVRMAQNGPARVGSRKTANQRFAKLTVRERQVLAHVLAGEPNKIIAADLGINQRTVENHRASVMRKTGAASLPALVRMALAADVQHV